MNQTLPSLKFWNNQIIALGVRLGAAALSFVFSLALARTLEVEQFGSFSISLAYINIGIVLALLGHENLATREMASAPTDRRQRFMRTSRKQVLLAGTAIALLLAAVRFNIGNETDGYLYLPIFLLIPLVARTRLSRGYIRGAHYAALALLPDGIVRPLITVIAVMLIFMAGLVVNDFVELVVVGAGLIGLIFGLLLERRIFKYYGQDKKDDSDNSVEISADETKLGFSKSMYTSAILAVFMTQSPLLLLGAFAMPEIAAIYVAADRLSFACGLIGQAVYQSIGSRIAMRYFQGEQEKLQLLVQRNTFYVALTTAIICLICSIFAEQLLGLFGDKYPQGAWVLRILLIGVAFNASVGPTGILLLMTKLQKYHMNSLIGSLIILIGLAPALIQIYGAEGMALAVLASLIVWNGLMLKIIYSNLGLGPLLLWPVREKA